MAAILVFAVVERIEAVTQLHAHRKPYYVIYTVATVKPGRTPQRRGNQSTKQITLKQSEQTEQYIRFTRVIIKL